MAATRPDTGKALGDFSNFGPRTVAVAAPGADVLSTTSDGGYGLMSGTSMAAPHVAGVVALMRSVAPRLSASEIRAVLLQNAARSSLPIGSGYVDARGAVRGAAKDTEITLGQRPRLRIVRAQSAGRGRAATTVVQFGVIGATEAVPPLPRAARAPPGGGAGARADGRSPRASGAAGSGRRSRRWATAAGSSPA